MRFCVVGSTLSRPDPRDFDLLGVIEDDQFKACYGLTPKQFLEEGRTGEWSKGHWRWAAECVGATNILQELLPERVPIEFKFIPESLNMEPNKPISLRQLPGEPTCARVVGSFSHLSTTRPCASVKCPKNKPLVMMEIHEDRQKALP